MRTADYHSAFHRHHHLQQMIEGILQGIAHMTVYLDNILVIGATNQEYFQNFQEVLTQLEVAGIQLKQNKCVFLLH